MKTMKFFKKPALLLSIVVLAVVLSVSAIAGAALTSEEETGVAEYGEKYSAVNVATSGKVSLKFYYSTYGTATKFVAEIIDPVNKKPVGTQEFDVDSLSKNETYGYCVPVALAPSQMTYTVKIYADGAKGAGKAIEYSVAQYAKDVLATPEQAAYHDAMRALLNWGAMAQSKFQDATSAYANVGIFERNTNSINGVNSISYSKGKVTPGTTITSGEMNLSLEPNNIAIHFYVNYDGEGTLSATVSKDGKEAVPTEITETGKGWLVRVANVPANMFDTPYTVTVTDGTGDTFTATKTVREYLGVLLAQCNATETDNNAADDDKAVAKASGKVVRAMYQLYQFTTGNTGADTCAHNQKYYYWVADGANTSSVRCNHCHTVLGAGISNDVNAYAHAGTLQNVSTNGQVDKTLMTEDGVQFVRYDNVYTNRDNWGDISLHSTFTGVEGVTGQYMVIKYRLSSEGNSRTVFNIFPNTNRYEDKTYHNLHFGEGASSIVMSKDDEWHTAIINLAERAKQPEIAFLPEEDGESYNVRYLSIRAFADGSTVTDDTAEGRYAYTYVNAAGTKYTVYGEKLTEEQMAEKGYTELVQINKASVSADAYLDLAYVALCDSEAEAKSLIDTAVYEKSTANDKSLYLNTADDSCAHPSCDSKEYIEGNTYSYAKCAQCGEYLVSRTLEDSVKFYFSPYKISKTGTGDPTNARDHYNLANKAFTIDNEAYFSFTGNDNYAQFIWNRTAAHKDQAYTMDIGLANYAVIKMRLSDTSAKNIKLCYGTAEARTETTLPVAASTTGKWATYVIDLAKVFGEYHVLNAESKTYKIDNLYLDLGRLESTTKVDVAYIAFVEGDLAEVAKLVDTDTALLQTANKGAATVVSGETGKCVGECVSDSKEYVDGKTYSYGKCTQCGEHYALTRTLEDSVKLYFSPYKISKTGTVDPTNARDHFNLANKAFTIDNEAYFSFTGNDNYAQFIWNRTAAHKDQAYTMDIGLANYAVIKMRLSDTSAKNIKLCYGTAEARTETTLPVAASTTGKWATYVIDLAKVFGEYHVLNAESKTYKIDNLYLDLGRLESTTKVDVAYIAFVEGDLAEVAKLVDTDTALLQTANKGAATVVSGETGKCVGECVNTVQVIDGVYKTACSVCGTVVRDHGVKADAVGLYWSAEELYRRSTATTQTSSTEGAYWEGGPVNQYLLTEDGETFLRISDMETKRGTSDSWGGWFPVNSGGGYAHPGSGRYMVIKVRQNDNSVNRSRIDFSVTSAGSSNTWDKGGGFSVYLPEDNQWHVIVVDLAARASGYTPDANDDYGIKTVLLRPFGGYHAVDTVTDEIMDIAYMAFFDDLADLKGIVKEGTYEWSVSDTENEIRDTATPEPVVAE